MYGVGRIEIFAPRTDGQADRQTRICSHQTYRHRYMILIMMMIFGLLLIARWKLYWQLLTDRCGNYTENCWWLIVAVQIWEAQYMYIYMYMFIYIYIRIHIHTYIYISGIIKINLITINTSWVLFSQASKEEPVSRQSLQVFLFIFTYV
jgi:hypothetical protein